ncbi:MAG: fluoride efflux transporter CrcB [Acidobacteria bacterium ACB1]|nr:fluoride efflux transporter CrcB [Acidobacteria bacterium ACB1]
MGRSILLVGIGGLIGSILRYLASVFFAEHVNSPFPYATLIVNIVGCFLIGLLFAVSDRWEVLSPEWRILLTTGFCGGFTTFSTFSYESVRLMQDGEMLFAFANVAVSVLAGFAATWLAIVLVRSI